MLTKLHCLSQQVRWVACILIVLFLQYENSFAFEKQVAKKTSGEAYPHILKKKNFYYKYPQHKSSQRKWEISMDRHQQRTASLRYSGKRRNRSL